jgi:hypothetical protein
VATLNTAWNDRWFMVEFEGARKGALITWCETLHCHLPVGNETKHEEPQVSGCSPPRIELWISLIGIRKWIGHIMRWNCLLKHVIEGKLEGRIEETERRGGRRKHLLDDLQKTGIYWELESGRTRSHFMENRLGKSLQTCGKTT